MVFLFNYLSNHLCLHFYPFNLDQISFCLQFPAEELGRSSYVSVTKIRYALESMLPLLENAVLVEKVLSLLGNYVLALSWL